MEIRLLRITGIVLVLVCFDATVAGGWGAKPKNLHVTTDENEIPTLLPSWNGSDHGPTCIIVS
jgi:hypothetical protein